MIIINRKGFSVDFEDGFIKLYKFTCQLPKAQAFMLSYLINANNFINIRLKTDINYFECTNDFIKGMLSGWSDSEINSAQKKLVDAGFIEIKKIKISNSGCLERKFIKLNLSVIQELYNKSLLEGKENDITIKL